MKKSMLPIVFMLIPYINYGQTSLPYYTGFDTPAEQAGWVQFSTGNTTAYTWAMGPNFLNRSAPSALVSASTEFASSTFADTAIQWFVSPGFHFHAGGKIDSFAINIFQAGGTPMPSDSIVLYLLKGSNNPTLATSKIRLANLTGMTKSDYIMRDTGNFIIPPTPGTSYIAFKYYSVYDWFQATIDNINISGNATTAISEVNEPNNVITIYPNPANNEIQISGINSLATEATIVVTNMLGQTVLARKFVSISQTHNINVSQIPAGVYCVEITTGLNEKYKRKLIISK